jgi:hypothetical protein
MRQTVFTRGLLTSIRCMRSARVLPVNDVSEVVFVISGRLCQLCGLLSNQLPSEKFSRAYLRIYDLGDRVSIL